MSTNEEVPRRAADALVRLVSGSIPKPISRGFFTDLTWGNLDLSSLRTTESSVTGDAVRIDCSENITPETWSIWQCATSGENSNKPIRGATDAGLQLHAEHGHLAGDGLTNDASGARVTLGLVGHYWSLTRADNLPSIWVGRLQGKIHVMPGNLFIDHSAHHLRIQGAYCYYFVRTKLGSDETWYIVIDVGAPGLPKRSHVYADFLALRFVLGHHLRLDLLSGIDDEGHTIAENGGVFGRAHPDSSRTACPVPSHFHSSQEVWVAPFFERLSNAYHGRPEMKLYVPLELYLDALIDHLDGSYLKLHVALEAFALNVLEQAPKEKTMIVMCWKEWSNWVNENREKIASFAFDEHKNSLVEKVRTVVRLASGRVVPNALKYHGIPVTDVMRAELEGRDVVAHTALMSPAGDRDYLRELERIALVRTMLVSLVACEIGYHGPIIGWTQDSRGRGEVAPSDWWNCTEEDLSAARASYTAKRSK